MKNVGKCNLSTWMLNFLVVTKNKQTWYNLGANLVKFHDMFQYVGLKCGFFLSIFKVIDPISDTYLINIDKRRLFK